MKKLLNYWELLINKTSFIQGAIFATVVTSAITIAATNLPGFFIFQSGTVISASEMNSNFEKVAGRIVLQTTLPAMSYSFDSGVICMGLSYNGGDCGFFDKLLLDSAYITISDTDLKETNNTDSTKITSTGSYSYYEVPADGWYEIRIKGNANFDLISFSCDGTDCYAQSTFAIMTKVVNISGSLPDNNYSNLTDVFSNEYHSALMGNSVFSINEYYASPGESERRYLKLGQAVIFYAESSIYMSTATVAGTVTVPDREIEITLIQL